MIPAALRRLAAARTRAEWLVVAIGSTMPAASLVVRIPGARLPDGHVPTAGEIAAMAAINFLYWAATFLAAFWLGRRFPLGRGRWLRHGAIHLAAAALRGAAAIPLTVVANRGILGQRTPPWSHLLPGAYNEAVLYLLVLGIVHAVQYYERLREREVEAVRLRSSLAEARLQALKTQLNPHFLFNALNSVSTLMHRDVDAAERVLARLSEVLRMTLQDRDAQEVPLRRELALLEPYLEIEQTRFSDRLRVVSRIDPEALDALVPHLMLQPLVENAIRHGISPRAGPGTVEVVAELVDGGVVLTVLDDGVGVGAGNGGGTGVGLSNTRDRLRHLYGDAGALVVEPAPGGGTRVTVSLPLRTSDGGGEP
ncbi:MAG TPA: histidine kinase [Longimicrobiaceae bacterium]|nr:histidine kinase [Longimicrobiaceae bacterium]